MPISKLGPAILICHLVHHCNAALGAWPCAVEGLDEDLRGALLAPAKSSIYPTNVY